MTASNRDAAEIGKELKGMIDYVRDCEARVVKGEIMDLQGLDKNVIDVCDAINKLPGSEGQKLESQMGKLIESLETLAAAMRERGDE